nr:hypothetical protein Iba_chr06aCG14280 [Ipomoea batatas]
MTWLTFKFSVIPKDGESYKLTNALVICRKDLLGRRNDGFQNQSSRSWKNPRLRQEKRGVGCGNMEISSQMMRNLRPLSGKPQLGSTKQKGFWVPDFTHLE